MPRAILILKHHFPNLARELLDMVHKMPLNPANAVTANVGSWRHAHPYDLRDGDDSRAGNLFIFYVDALRHLKASAVRELEAEKICIVSDLAIFYSTHCLVKASKDEKVIAHS